MGHKIYIFLKHLTFFYMTLIHYLKFVSFPITQSEIVGWCRNGSKLYELKFYVYLRFISFCWKSMLLKERETQRSCIIHHLVRPDSHNSQGSSWSQDPGASSSYWSAFTAFPKPWTGIWITYGTARIWSGSHMGCQCHQ